jgi:predicted signal transduction protein with EAL and GGDEF domain
MAKIYKHLTKQERAIVSASIGITFFPQDATTPENMGRNADQGMYVAKKAGHNRFSFFTIGMRDSARARLKVIDALRQALLAWDGRTKRLVENGGL